MVLTWNDSNEYAMYIELETLKVPSIAHHLSLYKKANDRLAMFFVVSQVSECAEKDVGAKYEPLFVQSHRCGFVSIWHFCKIILNQSLKKKTKILQKPFHVVCEMIRMSIVSFDWIRNNSLFNLSQSASDFPLQNV